jgi:hypothetical protein
MPKARGLNLEPEQSRFVDSKDRDSISVCSSLIGRQGENRDKVAEFARADPGTADRFSRGNVQNLHLDARATICEDEHDQR